MKDSKAKMHQIRFRLWLRPDPAGGAYSATQTSLAGFGGPLRGRGEGLGLGRGGEGEGGEGNGGPQVTVEQGPLRALLRH